MTTRPGNPAPIISTTAALGAAAGRNLALSPSALVLMSVSIVYVASATVGNRVPTLRVLDPSGNILWSTVFGVAVTASQTARLLAGSGIPAISNATPLQQTSPLPVEFAVAANSTIQILDAANVDVADTVQANISMSF